MTGADSLFSPLLNYYDAFGWIPTIRGALSLNLMGWRNVIWGDVDRYVAEFKNYSGLRSERYIAATSFHNVSDSKYGDNYIRTFRYFFYASIHNREDGGKLISSLNSSGVSGLDIEKVERLLEEGVLLGRLIIVRENFEKKTKDSTRKFTETSTRELSEREVNAIKDIQELARLNDAYKRNFSIDAVSLKALEDDRSKMKRQWEAVKSGIDSLIKDGKHQYEFEVLLTRDGILLLKDCTAEDSKIDYFASDTASDYTKNVPIHRIFKTAMNFMKFLFHTNYHHEEEHDTFLPASNLHPFRHSGDFHGIFKHQMDAFLTPLLLLRKNKMKHFNVDPVGIMHYAKSFVYVCRHNGLVSDKDAARQLDYIDLLEAETNHILRNHRSLLSSIATQRNPFTIFTTILAFAVAVLKLLEFWMKLNKINPDKVPELPWYATAVALTFLCVIGYVLFEMSSRKIARRDFHISRVRQWKNKLRFIIFHWDSNLEKATLSKNLKAYMKIQDFWFNLCSHASRKSKGKNKANTQNGSGGAKGKVNLETGKRRIVITKITWWAVLYILFLYIMVRCILNLFS